MKQNASVGQGGPDPDRDHPTVRFEATIHPGPEGTDPARIADLEIVLDRLPDPERELRLLLTIGDCVHLLDQGYEVRLQTALPVRPLSAELIATDRDAESWLEQQMAGLPRGETS